MERFKSVNWRLMRIFINCVLAVLGVLFSFGSTPPKEVTSNISKWILFFSSHLPECLTNLNGFISLKRIGFILITISILSFFWTIFSKYILGHIKFKRLNFPLLFTTSNPLASLPEVAKEASKTLSCDKNKLFSLLLNGYWRGSFDKKGMNNLNRLAALKAMHNNKTASKGFIFAYNHERQPATDLQNGEADYDKPILCVPDANTDNWTLDNCQAAFNELANQPRSYNSHDLFPEYIPEIMTPIFHMIKISQTLFKSFLMKENII